jgi:N4-gp56 family major capsid protein
MGMSWTYDVESGVFKNRVLSNKLYANALQNSVAMPYVDVIDGYGRGKGETVNWTRFTHIPEPASAAVTELEPLPTVQFSLASASVTISEYGVAVPYTGKLELLAHFNVENYIQKTLMEQKRLVLDTIALGQFKATNIKYVPNGAATSAWTYDGTVAATALAAMGYWHVEDLTTAMFDVLNIPYCPGDVYCGIFRGKTLMGLRRDSQFISWHQYGNAGVKAKGEIGTIERLKLIETNHATPLPYIGSNSFGQGVVFGSDAVGMIEALAPELRVNQPQNFGRFKEIAWYGMWGMSPIYSGATTAAGHVGTTRCVHVTSA